MEEKKIVIDLNSISDFEIYRYKQRVDIPILYEDNHIIAAIKPAGVLSQEDSSDRYDMLTILKEYIKIKYKKKGDVFLGLVHRLDCPVSGVMIFSRTSKSASRISKQIRQREVTKRYLAICNNIPAKMTDELIDSILKTQGNIAVSSDTGKVSKLEYKVISKDEQQNLSLLEILLHTGRTHQIRFQLKGMGCPIVGDNKYYLENERDENNDLALFSYYFEFSHPTKEMKISLIAIPKFEGPWNTFSKDLIAEFSQ